MSAGVQSFRPIHPAAFDRRPHAFYDRICFPEKSLVPKRIPFFREPVNSCKPGTFDFKKLWDTNMMQGCHLTAPSSHLLTEIAVIACPGFPQNWEGWKLRFQFLDKTFLEGPAEWFLCDRPLVVADLFSDFRDWTQKRNGERLGAWKLPNEFTIPSLAFFFVELVGEAGFVAPTDFDIAIVLDGQTEFAVR